MHSCLPCCLHSCHVNVMLITCLITRCLHDVVARLKYLYLLMLLFCLVALVVVSLQVHSMYRPGVLCQTCMLCFGRVGRRSRCLRARMCPRQCPCGVEFVISVLFRCRCYSAAREFYCCLV